MTGDAFLNQRYSSARDSHHNHPRDLRATPTQGKNRVLPIALRLSVIFSPTATNYSDTPSGICDPKSLYGFSPALTRHRDLPITEYGSPNTGTISPKRR
jgi:hypothetical protein